MPWSVAHPSMIDWYDTTVVLLLLMYVCVCPVVSAYRCVLLALCNTTALCSHPCAVQHAAYIYSPPLARFYNTCCSINSSACCSTYTL